jgi:hypothetical protein
VCLLVVKNYSAESSFCVRVIILCEYLISFSSEFCLFRVKNILVESYFLYVSIFFARFLYIFCQKFVYTASKPFPPSQTFGTCHYFMRGFNVLLVRMLCISRQKLFRRVLIFVASQFEFDFRHGKRFLRRFSCATVNNFAGFYYFIFDISFSITFYFQNSIGCLHNVCEFPSVVGNIDLYSISIRLLAHINKRVDLFSRIFCLYHFRLFRYLKIYVNHI